MTQTLACTNDLPIKHVGAVHDGKVRSVYWIPATDSKRVIERSGFSVHPETPLGVMVISDKISAFDCNWRAKSFDGVPGKGTALNQISHHWFSQFAQMNGEMNKVGAHHVLATPHPSCWIVQRAKPVSVEAIVRSHITGSMWRAYTLGTRVFCGEPLPDGLKQHQQLDYLLLTPTTKGTLHIDGLPSSEDANLTRDQLRIHYSQLGYRSAANVETVNSMVMRAYKFMSQELRKAGFILADTKFELGYETCAQATGRLIFIDEAGTPDSSRYWPLDKYEQGVVVEESKEIFRQELLKLFPEHKDLLLNPKRLKERKAFAAETKLPDALFHSVSDVYKRMATAITGMSLGPSQNAREDMLDALNEYGLLQ